MHIDEFLLLPKIRESLKRTSETQWQCLCPAHADGDTKSLCIGRGEGGAILLTCQAGCQTKDVVAALQLKMGDLFPADQPRSKKGQPRQIVAIYDYRDQDGKVLFQCVRFKPKSFSQRRPGPDGKWVWDLAGVHRVLYRLPELLQADRSAWVCVVEGEKDADNLNKLGFVTTTAPQGAGKWRSEYSETLRGRHVAILPDLDKPGRAHAEKVAAALAGIATETRIVELPSLVPPKKDASDWIEDGGTREELLKLIDQAKPYQVPESAQADTFNLSDAGNAERFVQWHKDQMRYDWTRQQWLYFDGTRWSLEIGNELANRFAFETARGIFAEADGRSYDERGKLVEWAHRSEAAARLAAMLNVARSLIPMGAYTRQFDTDNFVLNCANGTIDLRTGKLRPHRPENMITKISPVAYDPEAKLDLWQQFLETVCQGDKRMEAFLQTAIGYSITGDTREDKLFLIHGPAASGKSTFLEAIKAALGDYSVTADFETFLQSNQTPSVRCDIARLHGARFVVSIEVQEGRKLAEALVKSITGGDTITARHLYSGFFEFRPQCKLWLACNDAPRVSDTDTGLWRRILRVPFSYTIPKEKRDPAVKTILQAPDLAGPAILAWIVQGCLRWQKDGLIVPDSIEDATEQYRQDQDPLRDFFEEECEFEPCGYVAVADLRHRYEEWAKENGVRYTLSPKEFNKRLASRGCTIKSTRCQNDLGTEKVVRCWHGVTLLATPKTLRKGQMVDEIPI